MAGTPSRIAIYDTTLRDGMQGQGINYTLEDKIQIALTLDKFGIDYIEGGFPLSNRKEAEFFQRMRKESLEHARIVAFGSTRKPGGKAPEDPQILALLQAETPTVIVVGKTWKAHVKKVLQTTEEENLAMIADSLAALKKEGRETFFDLEHFFDGYKDDPAYALRVLKAGRDAGADCLVLCDTNGGTLPAEVARIMEELPLDTLGPIGVHFHDDTGNAVANALAAVERGAVHVQGTINGWGERCGNLNLCILVPNLCLKMGREATACSHMQHLTSLSRFVAEKANIIPEKRWPYVGEAAFSHKAGQHADVISKAPHLMEHIDGALVGNERRILLSELAGKSTIMKKLARYGDFDKSSGTVTKLLDELKAREEKGYEYEAAEASFDLVMRRMLGTYTPLLELSNYHLENYKAGGTPPKSVGRIFVRVNGDLLMGAGVGDGPVDTLSAALKDALLPLHPFLKKLKLTDYRVRVLDPERATAARVRVFITMSDGEESWDTVGADENIIEASWQALIDGLEYYYNNFVIANGKD
ncbi:MAG TPA: citramalate synthase [Spirochaetia bacterium]|nr:citramalate synthase [Spirochaetia bacterium]